MTPHGPDVKTYDKTVAKSEDELKPEWFDGGLAFMFESCYMMSVSKRAYDSKERQQDYHQAWMGFKSGFDGAL